MYVKPTKGAHVHVSQVAGSMHYKRVFGSRCSSDRYKSCIVAGRCLSALLLVLESPHKPRGAAMASEQTFIPTRIVSLAEGEVIGDILWDFSCKALCAGQCLMTVGGQCLMTVGGHVVRGAVLECKKRANAIRREDGVFDRVNPESRNVAARSSTQPLQPLPTPQPPQLLQQSMLVPTEDLATAAISICLAIQGTPGLASNLLPELEGQVAIGASELLVHEKIQLFEDPTTTTSCTTTVRSGHRRVNNSYHRLTTTTRQHRPYRHYGKKCCTRKR